MSPIIVKNLFFQFPQIKGIKSALLGKSSGPAETFALKNLDFEIKHRERVALIGGNGSGKTTLLKVLAGIYHPQKGQYFSQGNIFTLFNVGIGSRHELSGIENIKIQCLMAGIPTEQVPEYVQEVVEFSELGEVINEPMKTYSAGMAMRLQFAIATTLEPEILLLDEWIGAGDKAFQDKASARLDKFVSSSNTFLLASHNPSIVKKYCQRALWLKDGELFGDGPVDTVLREYNAYVRKTSKK